MMKIQYKASLLDLTLTTLPVETRRRRPLKTIYKGRGCLSQPKALVSHQTKVGYATQYFYGSRGTPAINYWTRGIGK